jgi:ABC-type antimicrobial peptide transport system permease subunit
MTVRTSQAPEAMFATLRRVVQEIDPNLPVYAMQTYEDRVNRSLRNERLIAGLSTVFGLLATALAMIGLYGVMAYSVTRRTREIGVRMAMGARAGMVGWLVMREVFTLVALGVAISLPAAWFSSRFVESQLYGVTPTDTTTIAAAVLALSVVAALAGLIPALRAARVNPVIALRYE